MKKIVIEIENCRECPNCRIERIPTEDRFEMVMDWLCCKALKLITIKHQSDNCPPIPDWCPLETIVEPTIEPISETNNSKTNNDDINFKESPVENDDVGEHMILTVSDESIPFVKKFNLDDPEGVEEALNFFTKSLIDGV